MRYESEDDDFMGKNEKKTTLKVRGKRKLGGMSETSVEFQKDIYGVLQHV
jgi:hypothetical protein